VGCSGLQASGTVRRWRTKTGSLPAMSFILPLVLADSSALARLVHQVALIDSLPGVPADSSALARLVHQVALIDSLPGVPADSSALVRLAYQVALTDALPEVRKDSRARRAESAEDGPGSLLTGAGRGRRRRLRSSPGIRCSWLTWRSWRSWREAVSRLLSRCLESAVPG
jgi:hypothetical protein